MLIVNSHCDCPYICVTNCICICVITPVELVTVSWQKEPSIFVWLWLILAVVIWNITCVFCLFLFKHGYLFLSNCNLNNMMLPKGSHFNRTWQLGPIWLVDPSFGKKEKLNSFRQKGHNPTIKRLQYWAWPMNPTKNWQTEKNTNRLNCWARRM